MGLSGGLATNGTAGSGGGGGSSPSAFAALTAYTAGQKVTITGVPGLVLAAKTGFTSASTFNILNWKVVSPAAINAVEVYGHSYAAGTAATTLPSAPSTVLGYAARLGRLFGFTPSNFALGGSIAQSDAAGGWTKLINRVATTGPKIDLTQASTQLVSLNWGINEVVDNTQVGIPQLIFALGTAICQARASAKYPADDATITVSGFGAPNHQTALSTQIDANIRNGAAAGNSVTIAVPATFAGGEVDAYFFAKNDGTINGGLTSTIDGGAGPSIDFTSLSVITSFVATGHYNEGVIRFTGLAAGAHTIVITLTSAGAHNLWFDGWSIMANNPPLVLVHNIAANPSGSSIPFTNTNAAIATLIGQFDSQVQLVDIATLASTQQSNGFFLPSNNLHPSDWGHQQIAQLMANIVCSGTAVIPDQADVALSW